MPDDAQDRLVRLVRRSDADLAEAALLCAVGCDPELDVEVELLRVDALADAVRSTGGDLRDAAAAADTLARHLGGTLGFRGDPERFHDPESSLLHRVLDDRQGLPITLTVLYVAIARRLRIPAYPIGLPGHVVAGFADGDRTIVLDPYHAGQRLEDGDLVERVRGATAGQVAFRRSMLRPSPAATVVRRLLNNLTRDLISAGRDREALSTVDTKLALPNRMAADHRQRGELLTGLGRFDHAATAFERFLELSSGDTPEREGARRAAIDARARMN